MSICRLIGTTGHFQVMWKAIINLYFNKHIAYVSSVLGLQYTLSMHGQLQCHSQSFSWQSTIRAHDCFNRVYDCSIRVSQPFNFCWPGFGWVVAVSGPPLATPLIDCMLLCISTSTIYIPHVSDHITRFTTRILILLNIYMYFQPKDYTIAFCSEKYNVRLLRYLIQKQL